MSVFRVNSALWCNLSSAGGSSFPRKFPNYANPQNIERFSFFIGLGNISTNNANICNNCCQGLESFEATMTLWMDKAAGDLVAVVYSGEDSATHKIVP